MRSRATLLVLSAAAALMLAGCSSSADEFESKLKKAGFDHVSVEADTQSKTTYNKKKKKNETKKETVAYDFDWTVNTDADPATCEVELEHAASGGALTGGGWHIDEVNGNDVSDSPQSPNADAVRNYLKSHNIDC